MAKDYAPRSNRRPPPANRAGLPGWVWMVFGLSIGLMVAVFVYISRSSPEASSAAAPAEPVKAASGPKKKPDPRIPLPPPEKDRFTFYRDLKKQQVYIPRDELPPPKTPAAESKPADPLFLIQVASFRAVDEAEREKAKLALLGIEARIEKVTVNDQDTYYRVRIGPMSLGRAQNAQASLLENGIQGIVVKAN